MSSQLELFLSELQEFIECESPSHETQALEKNAALLASFGKKHLGASPQIIRIDHYPHVLWKFGSAPTKVLLLGHHDTVWPLGTLQRFPFSHVDGVVHGPGSDDMKGGVLIALHALEQVLHMRGTLEGVTFLVTGDEELGSLTSRALIEEHAEGARASLVFESGGTDGAVKISRKGVAIYELEVRGRAAHVGENPESGINTTVELAHQILRIANLGDEEQGTTVFPTMMNAGVSVWIREP